MNFIKLLKEEDGFSLFELMIAMAITLLLLIITSVSYHNHVEKTREVKEVTQAKQFKEELLLDREILDYLLEVDNSEIDDDVRKISYLLNTMTVLTNEVSEVNTGYVSGEIYSETLPNNFGEGSFYIFDVDRLLKDNKNRNVKKEEFEKYIMYLP